jgi:hypothetical protein
MKHQVQLNELSMTVADDLLTSEQIEEMAFNEWTHILGGLWLAYGKIPSPEQIIAYTRVLKELPIGLLEIAINRVIKVHKYANVPTAAQLWEAADKELDGSTIEEWCDTLIKRNREKRLLRAT